MPLPDEVVYRQRLAEGFHAEARQDFSLGRWRACVDNSQLATENAAKAALALLGPVGRTHNPAGLLRAALEKGAYKVKTQQQVELLADCAELLGHDIHVQSDYGDEVGGQTPWELFDEEAAQQALEIAEKAVGLTSQIIHGV
jgi:HEPN domain-containing protein